MANAGPAVATHLGTATPYLVWNDALAARFFRAEWAGRRVFLYVNEEVVAATADQLHSSRAEFLAAVKIGPPWADSRGVCQSALDALRDWRSRDLEFPPYVGYLGAFVLAAGLEGDFEPWSYHPRLRALLELPGRGELPSFNRMFELWQDLEVWSVKDREGELGLFEVTFAGEWMHVGLPKAQALLTERERRTLPQIFAEADFDPAYPAPPTAHLARALRRFGAGRLTARTLQRLDHPRQDRALHEILLETVAEELASWDGTVTTTDGQRADRVRAVLRLTLRIDRFAAAARTGLRVHAGRPLPEAGLHLNDGHSQFEAVEEVPSWSTVLVDSAGADFDASALDWLGAESLLDSGLGWAARLPAYRVRLFVSGSRYALPDQVEVDRLPGGGEFFMAYREQDRKVLSAWLEAQCTGVTDVSVDHGLPSHWRLVHISTAADGLDDPRFPNLASTDRVRLALRGGIRAAARRNEYFSFALPTVVVENARGAVPRCNEQPLQELEDGAYALPDGLPTNERIQVSLAVGDSGERRVALYLAGDFAWRRSSPRAILDRWGGPVAEGTGEVAGAICDVEIDVQRWRRFPLLAAIGVLHAKPTLHLIGRRVGQVGRWPDPGLSEDWEPIWLVTLGRRGEVIYAGASLDDARPVAEAAGDHKSREMWKQLTWRRRKRLKAPSDPQVARLWREYQEAGKRA